MSSLKLSINVKHSMVDVYGNYTVEVNKHRFRHQLESFIKMVKSVRLFFFTCIGHVLEHFLIGSLTITFDYSLFFFYAKKYHLSFVEN